MSMLGEADVMLMLQVGLDKANEIKEPSCIAVVDEGGNLVAFVRSDNATFGTVEIAISKAYTSAAFRMPNGDLTPDIQPGGEIFQIETAGRGRSFTAIGGGLPWMRDGRCVGAIGVSGGPVAADLVIAKAMLEAVGA